VYYSVAITYGSRKVFSLGLEPSTLVLKPPNIMNPLSTAANRNQQKELKAFPNRRSSFVYRRVSSSNNWLDYCC